MSQNVPNRPPGAATAARRNAGLGRVGHDHTVVGEHHLRRKCAAVDRDLDPRILLERLRIGAELSVGSVTA
jgi:hypothetical protein